MNIARVNENKPLKPAIVLQLPLNYDNHAYQVFDVHFGEMESGLMLLFYLQSHCGSPFLGSYIGTVTLGHLWMLLNFNEKDLIYKKDLKKIEPVYPEGFPQWFQRLSAEDYDQGFCKYICSNSLDIKWNDYFGDEPIDCPLPKNHSKADQKMLQCNPQHCYENQVTTSLNYFVDHFRNEDTNMKLGGATKSYLNESGDNEVKNIRRVLKDGTTMNILNISTNGPIV